MKAMQPEQAKQQPLPVKPADEHCNGRTRTGGYCRREAGWGTDHKGWGRCSYHLGKSPNHRKSARMQLAALAGPAIQLAQMAVDETRRTVDAYRQAHPDSPLPEPYLDLLHKARGYVDSVLDRTGYPRTQQFDVDVGRDMLTERLAALEAEYGLNGQAARADVD